MKASNLDYKSCLTMLQVTCSIDTQPLHLICDYLLVLRVLSLHIGDVATRKRLSSMTVAVKYTLAGDQSK